MSVTHDIVLVADGTTFSMQGDLACGNSATLKMDTDELTVGQQKQVIALIKCLGCVGNKFGETPITSLSVTAI